jgi:flagellin-like protein
MKILKSKKALSPVVASIILIAVTVAVSIAVAAWMGALTFSFMGTEQLRISKITWNWNTDPAVRTFVINVNNTGTKDMTISQVLVNYAGVTGTITPTLPYILKATESTTLTVPYVYTNGTNYDISVATASNYKFTNTFSGGQNTG